MAGGKLIREGIEAVSQWALPAVKKAATEYRGTHTAPGRHSDNAPLFDMTRLYPDDVYGPNAAQYYGHTGAGDPMDMESARLIRQYRNQPDAEVTIYRAVPIETEDGINAGDWVTLNRKYGHSHGASQFGSGQYRLLEQKARARDLFTDANSIHEFGYDPDPERFGR